MKFDLEDTIVAVASTVGRGARGIVRCSGPDVLQIVARCCDPAPQLHLLPGPRRLETRLRTPLGHVPVALFVWPTSSSYTRQPSVEIHGPSASPVLAAIVETLVAAGARQARAGEFTLRAFLAGRLDLTQAEAVLGVIDSHSSKELKLALNQLAGGLAAPLATTRETLLELLADVEAGLDFVDEDIEFITPEQLARRLGDCQTTLDNLLQGLTDRTHFNDLPRVVLYGRTNAGKSALFNALLEQSRSIVSAQSATTRDAVTATVDWEGQQLLLVDTAGQLDAPAEIDQLAIGFMTEELERASIRILCLDSSRPLIDWERDQLAAFASRTAKPPRNGHSPDAFRPRDDAPSGRKTGEQIAPDMLAWTKCDLAAHPAAQSLADEFLQQELSAGPALAPAAASWLVSSHHNQGLDSLRMAIIKSLQQTQPLEGSAATLTRCRDNLLAATACLSHAIEVLESQELVSAELRLALAEIGQMTGTVYTDDILDRIFSRFCIGK